MQAIRILKTGGREVLQVAANVSIPAAKAAQVVVKNAYSGVNFIDVYVIRL